MERFRRAGAVPEVDQVVEGMPGIPREHLPRLLECPDWWMTRRFEVVDGDPGRWTHLTVHYLGDRAALESPERAAARAGFARLAIAAEPWFRPEYVTFSRHGERQRGVAADVAR